MARLTRRCACQPLSKVGRHLTAQTAQPITRLRACILADQLSHTALRLAVRETGPLPVLHRSWTTWSPPTNQSKFPIFRCAFDCLLSTPGWRRGYAKRRNQSASNLPVPGFSPGSATHHARDRASTVKVPSRHRQRIARCLSHGKRPLPLA